MNILLVEDNSGDVLLVKKTLADFDNKQSNFTVVDRLEHALDRVDTQDFDIVILDLTLPDSSGIDTVKALIERAPALPVVILTGNTEDSLGVEAIHLGAQDYLTKNLLDSIILPRIIKHALERKKLSNELQKALNKVKTLHGLLPICANCKDIRNDKGYYEQIEKYIIDHSDAQFTHGICPKCVKKLYPDLSE